MSYCSKLGTTDFTLADLSRREFIRGYYIESWRGPRHCYMARKSTVRRNTWASHRTDLVEIPLCCPLLRGDMLETPTAGLGDLIPLTYHCFPFFFNSIVPLFIPSPGSHGNSLGGTGSHMNPTCKGVWQMWLHSFQSLWRRKTNSAFVSKTAFSLVLQLPAEGPALATGCSFVVACQRGGY